MQPRRRQILSTLLWVLPVIACSGAISAGSQATPIKPALDLDPRPAAVTTVSHTPEEWKQLLSPQQFHVLREQGTERAFTGALWDHHEKGVYRCAACGLELFSSDDKFESGTGWPSYTRPIADGRVEQSVDGSLGMVRDEVHCARCGGHLGHVFDDGPLPTGKRYCINSVSLVFTPAQ